MISDFWLGFMFGYVLLLSVLAYIGHKSKTNELIKYMGMTLVLLAFIACLAGLIVYVIFQ